MSCVRSHSALVILFLVLVGASQQAHGAPSFQLLQSPGGIGGAQIGNNYLITFGTMNALGLGTPQNGLTVAALSNGALYFSQYQVQFQGLGGNQNAKLTVYVSTNFVHPLAQVIQNCPSTAACNTSGGYSNMSTVQGAQSVVVASMNNNTATVGLGIFLPDNNGASAFTGVDNTGIITFTMVDVSNNNVLQTATVSFNSAPLNTVENAVRLTLATAPGGLSVTPQADYSMNFGNVNGLGFGAGLTTVAAAGGIVYSTPYLLQPAFTDFNSTTATIKVFVSTNFAHPTLLQLRDAAASAGPYNNIGITAGTATQITGAAADRTPLTRFLGLFVSNVNGATSFRGSDAATLTFTMTVP
ncbi:MAG TPA: hypothetical protein VGQ12_14730 [Candidatus Angelobacter sp.]|nr:hypothetical protein [Candidatus Angelobacter sp.]